MALALVVGGILRFAALGDVPPSLYCDEAFQGYEAYSLLETGRDSRGAAWPLFFDTFGVGWEEPLYIYLTMIPVELMGTTEAATRVVAAASGTLSLVAIAWLAACVAGPWAGAGAALAAAVSPWSFHFSRVGFQASLLPLFLAAGVAALLQGVRPGVGQGDGSRETAAGARAGWLAAGALLMAASLYTYVGARLIVPALLAAFVLLHLGALRRVGGWRLSAVASLFVAATAPIASFALSPAGMERARDVGITTWTGGAEAVGRFATNYLSYFSPSFLLTEGDPNLRHSVAGFGVLHAHDLALLLAGLAVAALRRRPAEILIAWWLLIAPLAAALTVDAAHAVRSIAAVPAVYALAGSGASALFGRRGPLGPRRRGGAVVLGVFLLMAAASGALYLHHYFFVYPVESAAAWQYGLEEAFREVEALAPGHDSIYVTRSEDFPWIHRLYLFAFPPSLYQESGFRTTKYLFDEAVFYKGSRIPGRQRPIFLLGAGELEGSGLQASRTIVRPDGSAAFVIAW